jgi:hypothetical protein
MIQNEAHTPLVPKQSREEIAGMIATVLKTKSQINTLERLGERIDQS